MTITTPIMWSTNPDGVWIHALTRDLTVDPDPTPYARVCDGWIVVGDTTWPFGPEALARAVRECSQRAGIPLRIRVETQGVAA